MESRNCATGCRGASDAGATHGPPDRPGAAARGGAAAPAGARDRRPDGGGDPRGPGVLDTREPAARAAARGALAAARLNMNINVVNINVAAQPTGCTRC